MNLIIEVDVDLGSTTHTAEIRRAVGALLKYAVEESSPLTFDPTLYPDAPPPAQVRVVQIIQAPK